MMTIKFNARQRQYQAHKSSFDTLLLESVTDDAQESTAIATLEKALADYLECDEVIVCNTQYNAFVLIFMILGLKAGDEVITSTLGSGIAVQAALFMGAKVVFVDVMKKNFTLDVEQVEDAITERTKLIIPISLFGNIANMESINALALQHDLCVIEDAAESFGSRQGGQRSCQRSKLATTSFHPMMPLHGFGNGAALCIADAELREKARELRSQGRDGEIYRSIGIEACMDRAQAAIVEHNLSIFDTEIAERKAIAQRYTQALDSADLTLPQIDEESNHAFYPILVSERSSVQTRLKENGIESKVPFAIPLHLHPAFSFMRYAEGDFPLSEQLAKQLLLLPLNAYMRPDEQEKVIKTLLQ